MGIHIRKRRRHYRKARIASVRGLLYKNLIYLVSIIFIVGVIFGGYRLYGFMKSSEYFSIKKINVFGTKYSFADDIKDLSGISEGDNIFSFSSDKAAEQIKNHPWVRKVIVNKHLPDRVSIEVIEYKPAMLINFSRLYLVDENGIVFKILSEDELFDLPIISGITKDDYLNNTELYRQKILTIFDIESRFSKLFPHLPISEIVVEKDGDYTIITAKNSFEIRLGQSNYERKLEILSMILNKSKDLNINPQIVFLDTKREGIYTMRVKQKK